MEYILGVDGGGMKTVALLGDLNGTILGRGRSGPSNSNAVGFDSACAALELAIQMARADHPGRIAALCLGLAGAGRTEDIKRFQNWAGEKFSGAIVSVVSDAEALLAASAPAGPALALVCGTGSIVYGRTATGELLRAGGWGYLLGDEGSGYAIGLMALRAVMQAYDGRGRGTLLSEWILERYHVQAPPELVPAIYNAESPRVSVAALSDLVDQAAEQGDPVAIEILEESGWELARCIAAIYPRLGASIVPLIMTGGTILHGRYLNQAFRRACETGGLVFSAVHSVEEPAEGALKLAWRLSSGGLCDSSA